MAGAVSNGAQHSNGRSHAPAEVDSAPVLTRLRASAACRQPAQQHLRSFEGIPHKAPGAMSDNSMIANVLNFCFAVLLWPLRPSSNCKPKRKLQAEAGMSLSESGLRWCPVSQLADCCLLRQCQECPGQYLPHSPCRNNRHVCKSASLPSPFPSAHFLASTLVINTLTCRFGKADASLLGV